MRAANLRLVCILTIVALSQPAAAEEVPQSYLDEDYAECMRTSADTGYTEDRRRIYCECFIGELATLDFYTYKTVRAEAAANSLGLDTDLWLIDRAHKCSALANQ
jgi:hypothetical protein